MWSFIAICLMNAAVYLAGHIAILPSEYLLDVLRFYTMEVVTKGFGYTADVLRKAGLHNLFIWYSAIVYNTAPIIAGVAVLEILTDIYPAVYRMLHRRSPVYVFSQMNERAVILAEDLAENRQETSYEKLSRNPEIIHFFSNTGVQGIPDPDKKSAESCESCFSYAASRVSVETCRDSSASSYRRHEA